AGIDDLVEARFLVASVDQLLQRIECERTKEIVAGLVIVAGNRNEVAAAAECLIDPSVKLLFLYLAIVVERIFVGRVACREKGRCAHSSDVASVDHSEHAVIGTVAGAFGEYVTIAETGSQAKAIRRLAGAQVDRAASGR